MNVTFHTLTALATAAFLSSRDVNPAPRQFTHDRLLIQAVGFATGVLVHGMLDYVPHSYPIQSGLDVVISLTLFAVAVIFAKPRHRALVGACFLGSIFPDLVDLGPAIVNKSLGWSLPVVKIFPWHWPQFSGSVYDGRKAIVLLLCHLVVVGLSVSALYVYRRGLFDLRERVQNSS